MGPSNLLLPLFLSLMLFGAAQAGMEGAPPAADLRHWKYADIATRNIVNNPEGIIAERKAAIIAQTYLEAQRWGITAFFPGRARERADAIGDLMSKYLKATHGEFNDDEFL